MSVWIGLDGDASVQARRVILEIRTHEIGIHSMGDIGTDEEAVGVHLRHCVRSAALF